MKVSFVRGSHALPTLAALVVLLVSSTQAFAAPILFQGYYAPANWTFSDTPPAGDGSVNTAGAPTSIAIFSADNGVGGSNTDFTIVMPANGQVSFNWDYQTPDGPFWDPFGYTLNGTFFELTNPNGPNAQSGSASGINVLKGDTFGFRANSFDSVFGRAQTTITLFDAPLAAVPEPASITLFGVIAVGGAFYGWRRRRAATSA